MAKKDLTAAAQAVTNQFFSANEEQQSNERSEKKQSKGHTEPVKVFSFRSAVQAVDQWRLYASIRGVKVDEIGTTAMEEYLERHPLTGEEKALFDKRIEMMKA